MTSSIPAHGTYSGLPIPPAPAGTTAPVADTGGTASGYVTNNEFKRIAVTVAWTDAQGAQQQVTLEDAIAALSPADSAKVAKISSTGTVRGPKVRIWDPSSEAGVIPIAIGDDADTAATNPKPEVAGNNNNQRVIETHCKTPYYTYGTPSGGTALAQSRVETAVAGCTCDYGTADSTAIAKRPTYWNGLRYVAPEDASYPPPAGEASLNNNEAQSALCTACCRDHHDPASVAGAKFDPRNATRANGHYLLNTSTGALGSLTTSGQYTEACRLIRVNGSFALPRTCTTIIRTFWKHAATGRQPVTSSVERDDRLSEFCPELSRCPGCHADLRYQSRLQPCPSDNRRWRCNDVGVDEFVESGVYRHQPD